MSEPRSDRYQTVLRPAPTAWLPLARSRSPSAEALEVRAALGLPATGLIVASGHQAGIWHAGIAAKWMAVQAAVERARRAGAEAHGAWFVVDQDVNQAGRLAYPAAGVPMSRAAWDFAAGAGRATGWIAPAPKPEFVVGRAPPALDSVRAGLERTAEALRRAAGEPSLAMQTARAAAGLLPASEVQLTIVPVSALARTPVMGRVISTISRGRIEAYNRAVAEFPAAGLRPLVMRGEVFELPAWRVNSVGERRPAWSDDAGQGELMPRALLLTLLLRSFACDLFVHGLGGEIYDPAMEAWVAPWGEAPALAPAVVASATALLPLETTGIPTPEEIARAAWLAHAARHHPAAVGGDERALDRLREEVRRAPRKSVVRRSAYQALHAALEAFRASHAGQITALEQRAAELQAASGMAALVYDRTWPFSLHAPEALQALQREIRAAFAE